MFHRSPSIPRSFWFLACVVLGTVGCGATKVPVNGTVTMADGTIIPRCLVVFESTTASGVGVSARGEVAADGTYQLSTSGLNDGVPLGKYKVLVAPPPMVDAEASAKSPFNAKFSDFNRSQLEFEVKAGGPNNFEIKLTK